MAYDHKQIDAKWQQRWEKAQTFKAEDPRKTTKPKYYALDMFPYPSGYGLHVGHLASYTPTDVVSRYKRARGFNVLHPMGYDSFGLPAEQFAIQTGIHPAVTTEKAIESFRSTLKTMGYSFDWSREVSTCDPKFYKWTQFIFTKLFERGLAYQKEVPVNWCPALRTVLANEEVIDGKSERGGHPVIRVPMKQWMLKITDYAERLLSDLDKVDWLERTKEAQRNWIGKSEGANVFFGIQGSTEKFEIFTTRPDTLFGVTFMVLSPEHPLLTKGAGIVPASHRASVDDYQAKASAKSEVDRKAATEKTGVFTGAYAIHPFTGKSIPIWTADYVLIDYGTGAIMAVPGHDERDFEFAQTFGLEIKRVIDGGDLPFTGEGKLVNSDFLDGLDQPAALKRAIDEVEKRKIGTRNIQYKLRDWLFSRQRYWGEPFPVVRFPSGDLKTVPVNELPVLLPEVADYQPSEKGEAPLARNQDWVQYADGGRRETDTMPGSAGSSWYFLRYCDPHNDDAFCDFDLQKYWMPVDLYVGGAEHTVGHLLYSRFWQKVLFDAGLVSHDEPFQKLAHQGVILGPDGERMSKSRGNVVNPDSVREQYGADVLRAYVMFLGPMEADKPWQENGIGGVQRFLDRLWRAAVSEDGVSIADSAALPEELNKLLHKTIKKVGDDLDAMAFNTAISALMILLNEVYKAGSHSKLVLMPLVQMVAPFAPHVAEELWEKMGGEGFVALAPWPKFDSALTVDSVVSIGVQVNGKSRGVIEIDKDASEEAAVAAALSVPSVQNAMGGKPADKVIYKAGRILNLIVKS
ncbi:MAG: leucine--tRNA ligase [Bdellovibrionaceae bacterium]|nr:leucine--tRNA ligase [Pseudobdellovibrionaceae bacterium]